MISIKKYCFNNKKKNLNLHQLKIVLHIILKPNLH